MRGVASFAIVGFFYDGRGGLWWGWDIFEGTRVLRGSIGL